MVATKTTKTTGEMTDEDGSTRTTEQYRITIPKGIAEALEMDGDRWEWKVKSGDSAELRRVQE